MQGHPAPAASMASVRRAPAPAFLAAGVVMVALAWWPWPSIAQQQQQQGPVVQRQQPNRTATSKAATKPVWAELTGDQQTALRPLASQWPALSEAQKRKWIAMSGNYTALPPVEQAKLHSRMSDWVALSPQQRTQARLNFAEAKVLAPSDRKAKWEAYQALTPDEKRKLAADANRKTPPTAAAVRPVPSQKLANVPRGTADAKTPRIAAGPTAEPPSRSLPATHGAPASQTN